MTQAGCYQLVLDRKLGEYLLPDGWVVLAAGNPASERGVHFRDAQGFLREHNLVTIDEVQRIPELLEVHHDS